MTEGASEIVGNSKERIVESENVRTDSILGVATHEPMTEVMHDVGLITFTMKAASLKVHDEWKMALESYHQGSEWMGETQSRIGLSRRIMKPTSYRKRPT